MLIRIKNLKLETTLGVHAWEQNFNRQIIINAEIETDYIKSCESDQIEDTIDYDIIVTKIKNLVANNKFKLIEKLTHEMIHQIMEDTRVARCKLEVDKAKVFDFVDSCSVTIEKKREN